MKKQIFALASIVMIGGVFMMTSCSKEDITAPVITVSGGNTVSQNLPGTAGSGTWTNPTATATDDEDGDISASITVSDGGVPVNPNAAGTYTLTYTVSDAAGNTATETVTVNVVNSADFLEGGYNGADTGQITLPFTYAAAVSASNSVNGAFTINNFGGFGTAVNVAASLNGTAIAINPQPVGATSNLLSASGTVTSTSNPHMYIIYTWSDGTTTESCTGGYSHL